MSFGPPRCYCDHLHDPNCPAYYDDSSDEPREPDNGFGHWWVKVGDSVAHDVFCAVVAEVARRDGASPTLASPYEWEIFLAAQHIEKALRLREGDA